MDNLRYRIEGVQIDVTSLIEHLNSMGVSVSRKTIPKRQDELITFSLPVGKYGSRWLFRCSLKDRAISCSGGVTSTFFGHNVWVFKNEFAQLQTILSIVGSVLTSLNGMVFPSALSAVIVDRVEVTRHHLPQVLCTRHAVEALDAMFKAKFPGRHFLNGDTHDDPGTTGIGQFKSTRVCRVYDPAYKFAAKPGHVPNELWRTLSAECDQHLRVEIIFAKRELAAAGLSTVASWKDQTLVNALLKKRYQDYGLSVAFRTDRLAPEEVTAAHPAFIEAARHFFTDGERGTPIHTANGSLNRFKRYMAEKGYCADVPFSHHVHLAHGLSETLQPHLAEELPSHIRADKELFDHWWTK